MTRKGGNLKPETLQYTIYIILCQLSLRFCRLYDSLGSSLEHFILINRAFSWEKKLTFQN